MKRFFYQPTSVTLYQYIGKGTPAEIIDFKKSVVAAKKRYQNLNSEN